MSQRSIVDVFNVRCRALDKLAKMVYNIDERGKEVEMQKLVKEETVRYRVVYRTKDGLDGLGYARSTLEGVLLDAERLARDFTVDWVGIKVSDDPHAVYLYSR